MLNFVSLPHILCGVIFLIGAPIVMIIAYNRLKEVLLKKVVYKDNPELEQKRKRRELLEVKIILFCFLAYVEGFAICALIFGD